MANCSKTEVFLSELDRMCISVSCYECMLSTRNNHSDKYDCFEYTRKCGCEAIKAVQEWSDKHPKKTMQSEFLKLFPNARIMHIHDNEVLDVCPAGLDNSFSCEEATLCSDCKYEYWLQVVD